MFVTEEYKPPPFSPGGAFGASARNSGYATFDGNEMDVGPGATKQGRVTGYFRNIFHRSTGSESSDHYVHESSILPAVHIRVNRSVNNTRDNHFSIPADPFASPGLTPGQYSSGPANGDNSSRENLRPNSFQSASSASLYTDESSIHNSSTTPIEREGAFDGLFTTQPKGPSPDPGYHNPVYHNPAPAFQNPGQWVGIGKAPAEDSNPFLDGPPATVFNYPQQGMGMGKPLIDPFSDGGGEGFISPHLRNPYT